MKPSRPVLASVAAIAIAAGSFSIVHAADKDKTSKATVQTAAEQNLVDSPTVGDAAPINDPAIQDEGVDGVESGDAEAGDADSVDTSEFIGLDTSESYESDENVGMPVEGDDTVIPAQITPGVVNDAVTTLSKPLQVDPGIEARAQLVPDEPGTAAAPSPAEKTGAAMRKMTGPADAPRSVYGNGDQTQAWYGTEGVEGWYVHSESMKREIPVALVRATGPDGKPVPNAPTLYMLNGAGGSEQDTDWITVAKAQDFYKGKGVNVVIPMEGAFSYYVDWLTDGETLKQKSRYFKGEQKWSTFLGKELPPAVERALGASDKRGVLGFSMSGTSSLLLAEHFPGQYAAAGSFSGCAATSTPLPWAFVALTVNRAAKQNDYKSVTPAHIWGPMGSPYNRYNDALVNAEKLRNTALYISNGSGTGSQSDMIGYRVSQGQELSAAISGSMTTTVEGGVIEAATNSCTHDLRAKLKGLDIPAHYEFRKTGTHAWSVWLDDLNQSWNSTFGPALVGENFVRAEQPKLNRPTWNPDGSSK